MTSNFERDETIGLWKWPVLLGDSSRWTKRPCAVLFGRSQWGDSSLKHISSFNLSERWPHPKLFCLSGNLLVIAQGYSQEQALLFAEDVNRQLREVESSPKHYNSAERALTWGIAVPQSEDWDLSDALSETFALVQRAEEEKRLSSINIADDEWQNKLHEELVVCARRDGLTQLWNWRSVAALRFELDNEPLALLFGDVDGIRTLNDIYGMPMRNAALQAVGKVVRSLESVDVAAFRLGSNGFLVLARGFSLERAQEMAEAINAQLSAEELSVTYVEKTIPAPRSTWGVVCSTDVQLELMLRQAEELVHLGKISNRGSVNS